jgi:hypothetical protein
MTWNAYRLMGVPRRRHGGRSTRLCLGRCKGGKVVEILTGQNQLSSLNKISHLPEEACAAWRVIAACGPQSTKEAADLPK